MASFPAVDEAPPSGLGELIAWATRSGGPAVRSTPATAAQKLLLEAAGRAGVAVSLIEGDLIHSVSELHGALATAGSFPSYYGGNWDALADCWSDFHWLPAGGYLCVVRQAEALRQRLPDAVEILEQIAQAAAERYEDAGDSRFFKLLLLG